MTPVLIICHNNWGPPNAMFRDGLPCGLIDFDTIAPGLRLWDLGYSAWSWLDIGDPEYAADEQYAVDQGWIEHTRAGSFKLTEAGSVEILERSVAFRIPHHFRP